MLFTIFSCPTENEYLALSRFGCLNAEETFSRTSTLHI